VLFPPTDWIALGTAFLVLGGLVGLGERLRRWGWRPTATRRLVHLGVGLVVVGTPAFFTGPVPVYALATIFILLNATAKLRKRWPGIHAARPESWGTVTMPLALILALAVTWSAEASRLYLLQVVFLVLAVADPLASWAGTSFGQREWIPGATMTGSGTFAAAAFALMGAGLYGVGAWSPFRAIGGATCGAVVVAAVEGLGRQGWDNLFVVLGGLLVLVPLHEAQITSWGLLGALAIGGGFGMVSYAARALDARGAVAGGLFAATLVGVGGWAWALPGVVFFVLSSLLSLVGDDGPAHGKGRRATGRTLRQVLANGGVAWLLLGVFALVPGAGAIRVVCYAGFLGALASAAADTWATELGTWAEGRPWSLRTGTRVPAGESGAVSWSGTAAAACGAASVAAAAGLTSGGPVPLSWSSAGGVVAAGLAGMIADSLAGAFVQARYRDPQTGRLVEVGPPETNAPVRGWSHIDNETVNVIGTATGALTSVFLW
jgi:uncharacterized protein (TIGR00297 family)